MKLPFGIWDNLHDLLVAPPRRKRERRRPKPRTLRLETLELRALLASDASVSIVAGPNLYESGGGTSYFQFSLSNALSNDVRVAFALGGSAIAGSAGTNADFTDPRSASQSKTTTRRTRNQTGRKLPFRLTGQSTQVSA